MLDHDFSENPYSSLMKIKEQLLELQTKQLAEKNPKCKSMDERIMEIPKLFALYASDDVNIWSKLINRRLVHKKYGLGKIEKIYKQNEEIMIVCKFNSKLGNAGLASFRPQGFEEGFFTKLELLNDFGKYLLKNEDILIKKKIEKEDEFRRKEDEEKRKNDEEKRNKDEEKRINDEIEERNRIILRESSVSYCHGCKNIITTTMKKCNICGWYICTYCKSCGCNYRKVLDE